MCRGSLSALILLKRVSEGGRELMSRLDLNSESNHVVIRYVNDFGYQGWLNTEREDAAKV